MKRLRLRLMLDSWYFAILRPGLKSQLTRKVSVASDVYIDYELLIIEHGNTDVV